MKTNQLTCAPKGNPSGKVQNKADFSAHDLYVGIDVHKQRWQVAVCCQGLILSNCSLEANPEVLTTHLRKHYGEAHFYCVYESGPFGFGLCRALWAQGLQCMVVNPADIPDTHQQRASKTDPVDARKLATLHAAGLLQPIHVPSEKLQKQRSLMRFRKKLWGDLVRAKNRLKSELNFQGIAIPEKYDNTHWSRNFLNWIEEQALQDEDLCDTLLLMLEEIQQLRVLLLKTERKLRALMKSPEFQQNTELLRSIPGIGPLTALLFLVEVGDLHRFQSFDALNRFVGLCPDSHSSGERQKHTGLSERRHNTLRSALVEAAWQLIRRDVAMLEHYKALQKRMKGQQAIIRIARKLLRRMRAVLLSGKIYVKGVEGAVSSQQMEVPCLPAAKSRGRAKKRELATAGVHSAE